MARQKRGLTKEQMIQEVDPSPETVSLRSQLSAALSDVKALKAQVGDDETLFAYIRDSIDAIPKYEKHAIPKPKLLHADVHPSLVLADAHSEELVDPEQVEDMASYNWETFEARMEATAEKCVELTNIMRQGSNIVDLDIWCLGDWFLGQIHPDETAYGASMPLPCALPGAARCLADLVMRLSAHFEKIRVVGMVGNHGRTTTKPVTKMTADRNWDYATYLIAKEFTKREKSVEWIIPRSRVKVVEIMGHRVALTHGDICRRTHTIPYFGIINSLRKQWQTRHRDGPTFDYALMGHWHHQAQLEGDIFICPSLVGPSQFSQYEMHARNPAQQDLIFWSEAHGPTCRWPINL
jgi:hypothetical protein